MTMLLTGPACFGDARLPARFWAKVRVAGNGCWLWTGATSSGYGWFVWNGRRGAHQAAYETLVGPIPPGFDVDHLCHGEDLTCPGGFCEHRLCCNPAHLEPTTRRENLLRGRTIPARYAARDACGKGHPFDEENTYIRPDGRGVTGQGLARRCRQCQRESEQERKARRRRGPD